MIHWTPLLLLNIVVGLMRVTVEVSMFVYPGCLDDTYLFLWPNARNCEDSRVRLPWMLRWYLIIAAAIIRVTLRFSDFVYPRSSDDIPRWLTRLEKRSVSRSMCVFVWYLHSIGSYAAQHVSANLVSGDIHLLICICLFIFGWSYKHY